MKRWLACLLSFMMILNCALFPVYAEGTEAIEEIVAETAVQPDVPAEGPKAPVVEEKAPAAEPEKLAAEPETPVVQEEIPVVEPETPTVEEEVPEVEPETPVVKEEAPETEPETIVVEEVIPAVEDETVIDNAFIIDGDTLVRYDGDEKQVCIPDGIKCIGERAFYQNKNIEQVSMPSTVEVIETSAFEDCENLETIVATGLKTIQSKAFWGCEKLECSFANKVEKVAKDAFEAEAVLVESLPEETANIGEASVLKNDALAVEKAVIEANPETLNGEEDNLQDSATAEDAVALLGVLSEETANEGTPVAIIEQPKMSGSEIGEAIKITIAAENAETYQWQRSADNGKEWHDLANGSSWQGVDTATLSFTMNETRKNYIFRCVVTGGGKTIVSEIAVTDEKDTTIILNEVTYTINEDNTLTVKSYSGSASSLVIPQTVEGMTVIIIGESAFEGNTNLRSIDLPDTIQVIGKAAFKNCTNLSEMK